MKKKKLIKNNANWKSWRVEYILWKITKILQIWRIDGPKIHDDCNDIWTAENHQSLFGPSLNLVLFTGIFLGGPKFTSLVNSRALIFDSNCMVKEDLLLVQDTKENINPTLCVKHNIKLKADDFNNPQAALHLLWVCEFNSKPLTNLSWTGNCKSNAGHFIENFCCKWDIGPTFKQYLETWLF